MPSAPSSLRGTREKNGSTVGDIMASATFRCRLVDVHDALRGPVRHAGACDPIFCLPRLSLMADQKLSDGWRATLQRLEDSETKLRNARQDKGFGTPGKSYPQAIRKVAVWRPKKPAIPALSRGR